ncbi:MAG: Xaa-Pro aminopeptidase [Gemmatimonadetes bacterium]|nr:Xaa-Pro aminopeptidase [Gemmatimonadota bacterium]
MSRQGALLTAFTLCCVSSIAAQAGSPAGPVPVERLTARRDGLARLMGSGIAVLRSSKERDIEGDYPQDSDYRESNDFFYLTGIESKDSWLLVVADSGRATRVTLYLPPRDPQSERWTGPTLGPGAEATTLTGITDVRSADSAEAQIRSLLQMRTWSRKGGSLFVNRSRRAGQDTYLASLVFSGERDEFMLPAVNLPARRTIAAGDLVVLDVGGEYGYYSADVTRTVPISGKYTQRQRQIYELVLGTQQAAIDSVRPGMTVGQLNKISREYMKAHSGTLCGTTTCDTYYIHGLSHWLGMDVHDVGDYTTPFAPGMVLTVEPGIYIPDEQLGVRIEDDVLVTDAGHDLLSSKAPRSPDEIEKTMKTRKKGK